MVRMSMLRNRPVICQNRRIGFLQSISLDEAQKRVHALIVTSGIRGKRVVPAEAVRAIAGEFILADYAQKYDRVDETASNGFVRDTTGLLVGRVTDYVIDAQTLCVAAFEMRRGYFPAERGGRIWVFSYRASEQRAGELIVPTSLSCGLSDQREETESCVFQP